MKKVWIIAAIFSLLVTLNAKEVVGKYITYEPLEGDVAIMFQIDGKEETFFITYVDTDEEILNKRQNEFVRIKYSIRTDNGAEILENVYFNDGVTLLKEKSTVNDTKNYIDENEKACNNGDTQKCYELAQANAGFLEAPGYYNKACEGGHAKACYELAQIYELGNRAVAKDVELSKKFYTMACKSGYSDACSVVKKLDKRNKIALKDQSINANDMSKTDMCKASQNYMNEAIHLLQKPATNMVEAYRGNPNYIFNVLSPKNWVRLGIRGNFTYTDFSPYYRYRNLTSKDTVLIAKLEKQIEILRSLDKAYKLAVEFCDGKGIRKNQYFKVIKSGYFTSTSFTEKIDNFEKYVKGIKHRDEGYDEAKAKLDKQKKELNARQIQIFKETFELK